MFNQEDAQYQQFAQIYKNNLEEVLIGGKFVLQQNMGNFPVILYYLTNLDELVLNSTCTSCEASAKIRDVIQNTYQQYPMIFQWGFQLMFVIGNADFPYIKPYNYDE